MKIQISIPEQTLTLLSPDGGKRAYTISTSSSGIGTEAGSNKTPLGKFQICEKIGHRAPIGTRFRGRLPVGICEEQNDSTDLITSRILWLDGIEPENANTRARYIYIHGTNHEALLGSPASHGCIRMANADVVELYDLVEQGTPVEITG